MRIARIVLMGLLAGCQPENSVFEQTNTDSWTQAPTDQVDILFVIDDSHSMMEEQAAVAAGFSSFIGEIESSGTNFHLAAISTSFSYEDDDRGVFLGEPKVLTNTTPDYAALFQSRVQVGTGGSDKEKGLEAAAHALSPAMTTGPNAGFLRPEAYLLLVWVSDENDCSDEAALGQQSAVACYEYEELLVPVEEYVLRYRALKERPEMIQVGVIVGPPEGAGACADATVGRRYLEVAQHMGGLTGNICDADYSGILADLGLEASGIISSFLLTEGAQPDTITAFVEPEGEPEVEVPEDPANGWTYDPASRYLTFHGASVPPRGSRISASYTVAVGG